MWHQFIRLFPAHAVVLILLVVLIAVAKSLNIRLSEPESWNFNVLPWHFLMMHAWGTTNVAGWNAPSWSVSAEWFAYLIFPVCLAGALGLPRRAALPLALFVIILTSLLFHFQGWGLSSAWIGVPALTRVTSEFLCGVLIYRASRIDSRGLSAIASDGLAFGGLIAFSAGASFGLADVWLVLSLAALILGVSGPGPGVRALFANRLAIWLGEISYSIYMVHFAVLLSLRHGGERLFKHASLNFQISQIAMFGIGLAAAVIAAALLYYAVEQPARRRLRNVFGLLGTR